MISQIHGSPTDSWFESYMPSHAVHLQRVTYGSRSEGLISRCAATNASTLIFRGTQLVWSSGMAESGTMQVAMRYDPNGRAC